MESILSMHGELYPIKSRCNKSSSISYFNNSLQIRRNTLNDTTSIFTLAYRYIRTMIAQRALYILGILNLVLAGIAIVCVAHAEDHPEYFSLVYVAISIFIFYMATIIMIIILQIIETFQDQHQRNHSSLLIEIPLKSPAIVAQSSPMIVESMSTKTRAKTRLAHSHTLPLTFSLTNPRQILSTSTSSSSTLKDFHPLTSTRFTLLPKKTELTLNFPRNYQSFALTTNEQFSPSYTTITNGDSTPLSPLLIKPIPMKSHVYRDNNRSNMRFFED